MQATKDSNAGDKNNRSDQTKYLDKANQSAVRAGNPEPRNKQLLQKLTESEKTHIIRWNSKTDELKRQKTRQYIHKGADQMRL